MLMTIFSFMYTVAVVINLLFLYEERKDIISKKATIGEYFGLAFVSLCPVLNFYISYLAIKTLVDEGKLW